VYVESFYQSPATTVCILASSHPVVSVKIYADNNVCKVGQKIMEGGGQVVGGGLQMLNMKKPCTEIPKTSRLLLPGRVRPIFQKSKDVLTQTIRPPPFPLEV